MKNATLETAQKFVMHTNEFGYDMYVADPKLSDGCPMTDIKEEAMIWADGFDNTKLLYWRATSGMNLNIQMI